MPRAVGGSPRPLRRWTAPAWQPRPGSPRRAVPTHGDRRVDRRDRQEVGVFLPSARPPSSMCAVIPLPGARAGPADARRHRELIGLLKPEAELLDLVPAATPFVAMLAVLAEGGGGEWPLSGLPFSAGEGATASAGCCRPGGQTGAPHKLCRKPRGPAWSSPPMLSGHCARVPWRAACSLSARRARAHGPPARDAWADVPTLSRVRYASLLPVNAGRHAQRGHVPWAVRALRCP